jgi:WD40 repeat protein
MTDAIFYGSKREAWCPAASVRHRHVSAVVPQIIRVEQVLPRVPGRRALDEHLAHGGRTIQVWDAQTGQELLTLKGGGSGVAYSPDGKRLASASMDNTVKVWDAQTGEEILSLKGYASYVNSVAFSPDGKRLVSASYDKTVKLWDAQTGEELLTLEGHGGENPNGVAFSPDGHRLATGSNEGTVKIWDATPLPAKP